MRGNIRHLILLAAFTLLPAACSDPLTEGEYYTEWARAFYFGNGLGANSTFLLQIWRGWTIDEENLIAGRELHLELKGPPVEDARIPTGLYVVSDDPELRYTILSGRPGIYSYISYKDDSGTQPTYYQIESGSAKIDQHADGYGIKIRVIAGGEHFDINFDGPVWDVDGTYGR